MPFGSILSRFVCSFQTTDCHCFCRLIYTFFCAHASFNCNSISIESSTLYIPPSTVVKCLFCFFFFICVFCTLQCIFCPCRTSMVCSASFTGSKWMEVVCVTRNTGNESSSSSFVLFFVFLSAQTGTTLELNIIPIRKSTIYSRSCSVQTVCAIEWMAFWIRNDETNKHHQPLMGSIVVFISLHCIPRGQFFRLRFFFLGNKSTARRNCGEDKFMAACAENY